VASLVATGLVAGMASTPVSNADALNYFQYLCTLQVNTPLFYRKLGKRYNVFFDGTEEVHGEQRIRLRAPDQTYILTYQLAQQVEIAPEKFASSSRESQRGHTSATPSSFFSCFFEHQATMEQGVHSRLDCVIIGSPGRLREEITEMPFAIKNSNGKYVAGTLQDILRVRRFSLGARAYRSDIYHISSHECQTRSQEVPLVTIFDGATSFLTCRASWRDAHWIVLLDQTERAFLESRNSFNDEYTKHHVHDGGLEPIADIPKAISIAIFKEARI
jgi:hypothetical protein